MPASAKQRPRPRRVPQRTCVACRATTAKRELVRVVRTPDGRVELDPTGKRPGRGAYVHESRACWQQALARDRLSAALRTKLRPEDRAVLEAHAARLPSEPD